MSHLASLAFHGQDNLTQMKSTVKMSLDFVKVVQSCKKKRSSNGINSILNPTVYGTSLSSRTPPRCGA